MSPGVVKLTSGVSANGISSDRFFVSLFGLHPTKAKAQANVKMNMAGLFMQRPSFQTNGKRPQAFRFLRAITSTPMPMHTITKYTIMHIIHPLFRVIAPVGSA